MRRDDQSVIWYKNDQAKLSWFLPDLGKLNFLITDATEVSIQLIMGIYICVNTVRDRLEYFHLVATGCPHLQSKYAIFSVGHQENKRLVFSSAFHRLSVNSSLNSQPGYVLVLLKNLQVKPLGFITQSNLLMFQTWILKAVPSKEGTVTQLLEWALIHLKIGMGFWLSSAERASRQEQRRS